MFVLLSYILSTDTEKHANWVGYPRATGLDQGTGLRTGFSQKDKMKFSILNHPPAFNMR